MGCGGSKQDVAAVQQPQPQQPIDNNIKPVSSEPPKPVANGTTPKPEVKDEEEEEETGSDCLYISTDPGEETVIYSTFINWSLIKTVIWKCQMQTVFDIVFHTIHM